jgi:predicted dehydrogenase
VEVVTRVGVVGLNYWGPNLVRNFDELADLAWLCDLDEERLNTIASRYPQAKATARYEDLLADDSLDAIVVATPVPTHYALAKQSLEAGKHTFVEKPPAMRAEEIDELVALAADRDLVLMPGHLLLYHPGVAKVKQLIDAGELGDVLCVYGNRVNLGIVRSNENALWSLGVHDLSVILHLLDEDPESVTAQGSASIHPGVEDVVFCFLRFPSGKIAHMHLSWLDPHKMRKMTVVGSEKMVVFDDMEPERKVTVYEKRAGSSGELFSGDISIPKISTAEPLKLECSYFLELIDGKHDRAKVALDGARVVRALEMLTNSLDG